MALKELEVKYAAIRSRAYKLTDGGGLHLFVQPNGSKLWRMKYRFAGKEKLLSFGKYPDVPLAAARTKRDDARACLAEGRDPGVVQAEEQQVAERSVEGCVSEAAFDAKRRLVLETLGLGAETPTVVGSDPDGTGICGFLIRLIALSDDQVMAVLAVVMGETLAVGTSLVELLGQHLGVDIAAVWQADDALLDAVRDREVMGHILAEVAGEAVAAENAKATTKVQRMIVRDCLAGEGGRAKVEGWVPRWMTFPATTYTARGGVGSAQRSEQIGPLLALPAATEGDADQRQALSHAA